MDKVKELANFEEVEIGPADILEWAQSDEGGGLPTVSAEPFAAWLDAEWNEFDQGDETQTNEDVLKGALAFWTGQG